LGFNLNINTKQIQNGIGHEIKELLENSKASKIQIKQSVAQIILN